MFGTDIKTTIEGTTVLKNGDFDIESDLDSAISNRVLRASKGAWKYDPEIGVGLQDYAGMPNNEETGVTIEDSVVTGLGKVGINAQCIVYPTSFDSVSINVVIYTPNGPREMKYSFRYEDALVTYLETEADDTQFVTRKTTNKYDLRRL
jgi:hypothetical protein